jgi:hypothetical protein
VKKIELRVTFLLVTRPRKVLAVDAALRAALRTEAPLGL